MLFATEHRQPLEAPQLAADELFNHPRGLYSFILRRLVTASSHDSPTLRLEQALRILHYPHARPDGVSCVSSCGIGLHFASTMNMLRAILRRDSTNMKGLSQGPAMPTRRRQFPSTDCTKGLDQTRAQTYQVPACSGGFSLDRTSRLVLVFSKKPCNGLLSRLMFTQAGQVRTGIMPLGTCILKPMEYYCVNQYQM